MLSLFILFLACSSQLVQSGPVVFEEYEEDIFADLQLKHEECWSNSGMVYWNETSQCYKPATQGPCSEGEWIVLVGNPSQISSVQCRPRPCPLNHALVNNTCYLVDQRKTKGVCSAEEVLLNSPFGDGQCVCRRGYLLWEDGRCYQPYTRGPCPEGSYLQYNSSDLSSNSSLQCAINTCKQDGIIPYAGSCFKLGGTTACKAPEESLELDLDTLQPKCLDAMIHLRQIAIARYHCGSGSPLLRTRYCRAPFEFGKPRIRF